MLRRLFLDHPRSVGESYGQHFAHAAGFGVKLLWAGTACVAHAVVPALFKTTGSQAVRGLHDAMVVNRRRLPAQAEALIDYVI